MPFRHRTFGSRFLLYFSSHEEKNNEARYSLNAVEREPVSSRVLNLNASEASYKPKQRSYRKKKQKKLITFFLGILVRGFLSGGFHPGTVETIGTTYIYPNYTFLAQWTTASACMNIRFKISLTKTTSTYFSFMD